MNIVFFECNVKEEQFFSKAFPQETITFYQEPLSREMCHITYHAEIISIFVYSQITEEILTHFPNLKMIITRSTGYDHIDLEGAKKRGITVCNAPCYAASTVAEHTFALLLCLTRNIFPAYQHILEQNNWSFNNAEALRGSDLFGKTIGIVGFGNIGQKVGTIALAFDMRVLIYDPYACVSNDQVTQTTYDELLTNSDIITFHTQLTPKTHHIFNDKSLKLMRPGTYLINTARGEIIDTQTLIKGLKKNLFAGVGLDVLEKAYYTHEYLLHDTRVIMTPHNAYNSYESHERIMDHTVKTIKQLL